MYTAKDVAKWFINELHPEPLKLQKLLYLAQGFSFAFNDEALFEDDMEAWVHGPVVKSVYEEYKNYKYSPITINYEIIDFNDDALSILNYVKNNFSKFDSKYLENISHNQEPWIMSREGLDPDERSDKTISKLSIANYFTNYINQPDLEDWN